MKKWMIAVCTLVLTITMIATPAIAARANACRGNAGCTNKAAEKNCSGNYVDEDEDGICDNKDRDFADADKDGVCGYNAAEKNCGGNYVDEDEDGICDNKGSNFVDEDADGVCDKRQEKQTDCQGNRCGRNGEGRGKQAGKNK